jgi:hypothetical protein
VTMAGSVAGVLALTALAGGPVSAVPVSAVPVSAVPGSAVAEQLWTWTRD